MASRAGVRTGRVTVRAARTLLPHSAKGEETDEKTRPAAQPNEPRTPRVACMQSAFVHLLTTWIGAGYALLAHAA